MKENVPMCPSQVMCGQFRYFLKYVNFVPLFTGQAATWGWQCASDDLHGQPLCGPQLAH
jgi:hypothetical protein